MVRLIGERPTARLACVAWPLLLAPGLIGCSLFAPSLSEYAQSAGAAGASASVGLGGGANTSGGSAGVPGTAGSAGTAVTAAGAGGTGGAPELGGEAGIGEAGWTGEIEVGQAIASADLALEPVAVFNLPAVMPLTSYAASEADVTDPTFPHDAPLYTPYDSTAAAWWDNLLAEQTHARVANVMLPSHGAYSLTATDLTGPDAMNPRRLSAWVSALERAGATDQFLAACYVDTPSLQAVKNKLHNTAAGTLMDLSVQADWDDVIWKRSIKPWFDTIPQSYWYQQNDGPLIQFGPLSDTSFKNSSGNLSTLLSSIASSFHDAYNTYPSYVLDATWMTAEPSLSGNRYVVGQNSLLGVPPTGSAFANYNALELGAVLPGYTDPTYYQSASANYHDASLLLPRKTVDSYGKPVFTLETGLANAASNRTSYTVLQDFTDVDHWSGVYRSDAANWDTPNEYLNLIRRYSDRQTLTQRLEAEACDKYYDTTSGNSGATFRRAGDLDVRALSSNTGWAVTNTAAKEWVEFDGLDFSAGNYQIVAKYSTSGAATVKKRIQPFVDGVGLTPVIATNTANADTFANALLAKVFLLPGQHDFRVRFVDGLLDLDWLFLKKVDPIFNLKSNIGKYVTADLGGGGNLIAEATKADVYEKLFFADVNGGSLQDGDAVYIQAWGGQYLSVSNGQLTADHLQVSDTELFTVHNTSGGTIAAMSVIAILSSDGTHYLSVVTNGLLDASGTTIGDAQKFTLGTY